MLSLCFIFILLSGCSLSAEKEDTIKQALQKEKSIESVDNLEESNKTHILGTLFFDLPTGDNFEQEVIFLHDSQKNVYSNAVPMMLPYPLPHRVRLTYFSTFFHQLRGKCSSLFGTDRRSLHLDLSTHEAPNHENQLQIEAAISQINEIFPNERGLTSIITLHIFTDENEVVFDIHFKTPPSYPMITEASLPEATSPVIRLNPHTQAVALRKFEFTNHTRQNLLLNLPRNPHAALKQRQNRVSYTQGDCRVNRADTVEVVETSNRFIFAQEGTSAGDLNAFIDLDDQHRILDDLASAQNTSYTLSAQRRDC